MAETDHEGFLRHARFRWLKAAMGLSLVALIGYLAADVGPRPNGGTWYGYTLGTIGAGLIVWLALLGVRKRTMTRGRWSLKAWTSAHVYLGLSLVVVATLHAGFQFGWNVHTLAWVLMMLVIASGIWGIVVYATLPTALSSNRGEMTQTQMVEGLAAIDRQLHDAAQGLASGDADAIRAVLAEDPLSDGLLTRLGLHAPRGITAAALPVFLADPRIAPLLEKRLALIERTRTHLRIKARLEVWLFVHVPLTFALLAALTAHVISVFYYW